MHASPRQRVGNARTRWTSAAVGACGVAALLLLSSAIGAGVHAATPPAAAPLLATQESPRTVWAAIFSTAQADRGSAIYKKECASCHGDGLTGVDEAPALVGATFLSNWNGQTAADLVDLTRKSMPKDNESTLTRQQYVDVTAYVFRVNGFPSGQVDLPVSALQLGQIRIDAFRDQGR